MSRTDIAQSVCLSLRYVDGVLVYASWTPHYAPRHPIEQPKTQPPDVGTFYVELTPLWPLDIVTPWTICTHGEFPRCCPFCCGVCDATGYDWHPGLALDCDEAALRDARAYRAHGHDVSRLTGGRGQGTREWRLKPPRGKHHGFTFRRPRSGPPWPSHHRGHR
jgi:hypothetical protein